MTGQEAALWVVGFFSVVLEHWGTLIVGALVIGFVIGMLKP
jgi:hypothetical protein